MKFIIYFIHLTIFAKVLTSVDMSFFSSSRSLFRGLQTYKGPSFMAGPSFKFFDKWSWKGPGISYSHFSRRSPWKLEIGTRLVGDEPPLIRIGGHGRSFQNSRDNIYELYTKFSKSWGKRAKVKAGLEVSKGFVNNGGYYFAPFLTLPVVPFVSFTFVQTFNSKRMSKYLYGLNHKSGLGHSEYSLSLAMPWIKIADFALLKASKTIISHGKNRHAELVKSNYNNDSVFFMMVWNIYRSPV